MNRTRQVGGVFNRFIGDDWTWEWTTTDDVSARDAGTVLISLACRKGGTAIASTNDATITTTGTSFTAGGGRP